MKKWYCPNCGRFKRFSIKREGMLGFVNLCPCCRAKLYNAKDIIKEAKERYVRNYINERSENN